MGGLACRRVDDDGVVMGVTNRAGKMLGVGRLNCAPNVLAFRAADHDAECRVDRPSFTAADRGIERMGADTR